MWKSEISTATQLYNVCLVEEPSHVEQKRDKRHDRATVLRFSDSSIHKPSNEALSEVTAAQTQ